MNDSSGRGLEIMEQIKLLMLKHMPEPGILRTKIPTVQLVRRNSQEYSHACLEKPLASLFVQGNKNMVIGPREYDIKPGDCMVVAIDMPSSSRIIGASPVDPFLCIVFDLDKKIFADLLMQMRPPIESAQGDAQGVWVVRPDIQFLEAVLRLARLIEKPEQCAILGQMVLRELHYYLLAGPEGGLLRDLYMQGAKNNQIMEVLTWLKNNLSRPVRIEELARQVHMSVSSLHRHFKEFTGLSPLQYHKQLRLYEAQRLMLSENERAASAALSVGYESVTQFNREYKRLFGLPPHRDINRRKGGESL